MSRSPDLPADALFAHAGFVRALARGLLREEGDDLAQEALLRAARGRPGAPSRPWLAAVVRNLARDRLRESSRRSARERAAARPETVPSAAEVAAREELRRRLIESVLALEEPSRSALLLRFYEDLPPRAIAARLGLPVETVRTRIKRGLERLRRQLDADHGGDRSAWAALLAPALRAPLHSAAGTAVLASAGAKAGLACAAAALLALGLWWSASAGADGSPVASAPDVVVAADPREPVRPAREPAAAPKVDVERGPTTAPPAETLLVVRARERASGIPLRDFGCIVRGEGVGHASVAASGGVLEHPLRLGAADSAEVTVELRGARGARAVETVRVAAGERRELVLFFDWPDAARGVVVDAFGAPVEGALVFFGLEERLRGDEPFKPLKPERVRDGVRTAADGAFELAGRGRWITAVAEGHGVATLRLQDCERIALPALGSIHGLLVDAAGAPLARAEVLLDREPRATTDAAGRFEIEGVDPGVRGLQVGGTRAYVAVEVAPAEATEVRLEGALPEVRLEVGSAALAPPPGGEAALVPLEGVGLVHLLELEQGVAITRQVMPGRHVLLLREAACALVDVGGPLEVVDLGDSSLTVRAAAGTPVRLVPAGSSELVELLAWRVPHDLRADASGEVRFAPLRPGRYRLLLREGESRDVDVSGESVLELDQDG